jgi:hypothetical protein
MRHIQDFNIMDSCSSEYNGFRFVLYAMQPEGRYALSVEFTQQDRVVASTIIDLSQAAASSVIRPDFAPAAVETTKTEPKQETSAIGVFLPGVTSGDTVIVDMPDGQFRVYDDRTKSFQTINKKKTEEGVRCECNIAALASGGCGCRGVMYSTVDVTTTPPEEVERQLREAFSRGPVGAAIGTAAGAAVPIPPPASLRDYVRRRTGGRNILRGHPGVEMPRPGPNGRSSSDADIERELTADNGGPVV